MHDATGIKGRVEIESEWDSNKARRDSGRPGLPHSSRGPRRQVFVAGVVEAFCWLEWERNSPNSKNRHSSNSCHPEAQPKDLRFALSRAAGVSESGCPASDQESSEMLVSRSVPPVDRRWASRLDSAPSTAHSDSHHSPLDQAFNDEPIGSTPVPEHIRLLACQFHCFSEERSNDLVDRSDYVALILVACD